ncbi:hypothetical protein IFM89_022795 [Coptis chinensis]|uniref:Uncharacterized protein n=1 Tax=Coptis chinensis TaxID=261450 RepID=A0A835I2M0_9MAGN|nr:hypothetical protein IFM89_022795 [Coptis chinensis]
MVLAGALEEANDEVALYTGNPNPSVRKLRALVGGLRSFAGRFRCVAGNWKIVRRRARKQHLLAKKNAKRRNRLSKMGEPSVPPSASLCTQDIVTCQNS